MAWTVDVVLVIDALEIVDLTVGVVAIGALIACVLSAHTLLNAQLLRRPTLSPPILQPIADRPVVSVLIPARNEAQRIGPTIASLLASGSLAAGAVEILVLDDQSDDGTADVVRATVAASAATSRVPNLRILPGTQLPDGWMGKPWACQQLGELARGDVLLFVDADVVVQPCAVSATVHLMNRYNLSLVSPYPRQVAISPAERVLQPLLQWLWLTFLPLRLAERPRPLSMAAANGQLLAIRQSTWRKIGGHAAVRNNVIEDVGLAVAVKRNGERAVVAEGSKIATCRMYTGWEDLRDGYSKSIWAALPNRVTAWGVAALLALAYVLPVIGALVGAVTRNTTLAAVGLVGYFGGVLGRVVSARTTGGRVVDTVAHPISICTLLWLGARSGRLARRGQLRWKGRVVDGTPGSR